MLEIAPYCDCKTARKRDNADASLTLPRTAEALVEPFAQLAGRLEA